MKIATVTEFLGESNNFDLLVTIHSAIGVKKVIKIYVKIQLPYILLILK